jgi:hypothetical protein
MGASGTVDPSAAGSRGREGSPMEADARRAQRRALGDADGCTMEGHARSVPSVRDVPSPVQRLGSGRQAAPNRGSARRRLARARRARPRGGVRGRYVRGGQKGGSTSEKRSVGRGPRSWQWSTALVFLSRRSRVCFPPRVDALGRPSSPQLPSAPCRPPSLPHRRDNAYDCDPFDARLARQGITLIARSARIARSLLKTGAISGATSAAGRSSASAPGPSTSADWSHATSSTLPTSSASSTSPARFSYSDVYETPSSLDLKGS